MNENIIMPKRLTAENGAKGLMIGEFFEYFIMPCPACDDDDDGEDCDMCGNCGELTVKIPVQWTTIKDIYARPLMLLVRNTKSHENYQGR